MDPSQIVNWSFGRNEAANLVGMSSVQVSNYLKRYDLFPNRPRGKGYHVAFRLADLMRLCAVKALIDCRFTPEEAAGAMRSIRGPYSAMRTDGFGEDQKPLHTYPGTLFFSRNHDGHLVQVDTPDIVVGIQVRCWPIFDDLWPRVRARILAEGKADPAPYPGDVEAGIAAFEVEIAALRALRWNKEV